MRSLKVVLSFVFVCALATGAFASGWFRTAPPTPIPVASFKLADVVGDAGDEVRFDGVLERGESLASLSVDVLYDPADLEVVRTDNGNPKCNIASNESAGFLVVASDVPIGGQRRLRVGLISTQADTLRDGLVFHCAMRIVANRSPGVIFIEPSVSAADALAKRVAIEAKRSTVQVVLGAGQQQGVQQ